MYTIWGKEMHYGEWQWLSTGIKDAVELGRCMTEHAQQNEERKWWSEFKITLGNEKIS